jgi:hypothetical protein
MNELLNLVYLFNNLAQGRTARQLGQHAAAIQAEERAVRLTALGFIWDLGRGR